jgi:hypothetical protein
MEMAKVGYVNIKGKEYKTVALRVAEFRADYKGYSLTTEIVSLTDECCVMKASITLDGVVLANGYAQEYKNDKTSVVNLTSYVENAETSAVGRALACFGLGGQEYVSADEIQIAIAQREALEEKPKVGAPLHIITRLNVAAHDGSIELAKAWSALTKEERKAVGMDKLKELKEAAAIMDSEGGV